MIIFRYFAKEVLTTLTAVTVVLLLIFLSNQLVHFLGLAAGGKLAGDVVFRLLGLQIPVLLGLLLPLGLYIGILLAYGRMYADNEMTVLAGCGVSQRQVLIMTLKIAAIVAVIVAIFMLWINPAVMAYRDKLMVSAGKTAILRTIMPGRFRVAPGGQSVFYVKGMSRDRTEAEDVFMARRNQDHRQGWDLLSAHSTYQTIDKKTGDPELVINNGYRYMGQPGGKEFRIIKFKQYRVRIDRVAPKFSRDSDAMTTMELLRAKPTNLEVKAEFQWRLSLPLSALLLALLALPLSRVNPRQGKYARMVPAILIYVVYANMMFVDLKWTNDGKVPLWLGLWWVHVALLILIGLIYWYQSMRFSLRFRRG